MAVWQCDFELRPFVSSDIVSDPPQWRGYRVETLGQEIAAFLDPILPSPVPGIHYWGSYEGDRIELVLDEHDDDIVELNVRVDARQVSFDFLEGLLRLAAKNRLAFYSGSTILVAPTSKRLLVEIEESKAFKFVAAQRGGVPWELIAEQMKYRGEPPASTETVPSNVAVDLHTIVPTKGQKET